MGTVYTPICGTVLCGQTNVATWRGTLERPKLSLNARAFTTEIIEGPLIQIPLGRPRLVLDAGPMTIRTTTSKSFQRPALLLRGRAFIVPPFTRVELETPRLYLKGKSVLLATSMQLQLGRPVLSLLGRPLLRAGRAGLVPTTPRQETLTPSPSASSTLSPSPLASRTLAPSPVDARGGLLVPTDPAEDPGDLLTPSESEVR